ncbi:MAG: hypothetical protein KDD64_01475 [Bdellovibrionales bacterium]|nr:hypothetical protein [Bdellovibrionales bacterium]
MHWLVELYEKFGNQKDQEGVSLSERALRSAMLAEREGHDSALITACLLQDLGKILRLAEKAHLRQWEEDDTDSIPDELRASQALSKLFGLQITEPIRLQAKAADYFWNLDNGSDTWPPSPEEERFVRHPYFERALMVVHYRERSTEEKQTVPSFRSFLPHLEISRRNS